jgi:hypothetical protein
MKSEWCCPEFQERFFQAEGRQDGLGILWIVRSRAAPVFLLEYRRPNRMPPEPIAEDGIKLKFCPWCGRNLLEQYGSDARLVEEGLMFPIGQIDHAAVWVCDLERARAPSMNVGLRPRPARNIQARSGTLHPISSRSALEHVSNR